MAEVERPPWVRAVFWAKVTRAECLIRCWLGVAAAVLTLAVPNRWFLAVAAFAWATMAWQWLAFAWLDRLGDWSGPFDRS